MTLSDLINAILQWSLPMTVVQVLNPDMLLAYPAGKRVVLDILVRDASPACRSIS